MFWLEVWLLVLEQLLFEQVLQVPARMGVLSVGHQTCWETHENAETIFAHASTEICSVELAGHVLLERPFAEMEMLSGTISILHVPAEVK